MLTDILLYRLHAKSNYSDYYIFIMIQPNMLYKCVCMCVYTNVCVCVYITLHWFHLERNTESTAMIRGYSKPKHNSVNKGNIDNLGLGLLSFTCSNKV